MKTSLHFGLTLCAWWICASLAQAQQQPTGSWAPETSGVGFSWGGSAADGTYLYVIGGGNIGSGTTACRRYDPVNNTWTALAGTPSAVTANAGAYYNGVVYSFGGVVGNAVSGVIYAYTVATNQWTTLAGSLPVPRFLLRAATLGDRIYIAGGLATGFAASAATDEFDPATGSVTARANMPAASGVPAMAAVDALGKLYVMGDINLQTDAGTNICYEYTPNTDTWATRATMPVLRGAMGCFSVAGRVYATGGYSSGTAFNTTYEYNPFADSWTRRADMAVARYVHAAVAINGRGYVYGGVNGPSELNSGEEFTPPVFMTVGAVTQSGTDPESSLQASDPSAPDGWTDGEITFTATNVTTGGEDYVRLRVRIKEINAIDWTYLASAWSPQGDLSISHSLSGGSYDWQYRVEDVNGGSLPASLAADPNGWLNAFGNTGSPDFRVPQGGAPPKEPPPPPASSDGGGGGGGGGCSVRVPASAGHAGLSLGLAAILLLLALAVRKNRICE